MPTFAYQARDKKGATRSGNLVAGDRRQALQKLRAMRLQPISVDAPGEARSTGEKSRTRPPQRMGARAAQNGRPAKAAPPKASRPAFVAQRKKASQKGRSTVEAAVELGYAAPEESEAAQKPRRRLVKASRREVSLSFVKRLHELHSSGMPIGDCFQLLTQRLSDPQLREIAAGIWRELSEGRSLGDALRGLPQYFDESTVTVIEAGEATGQLAPILARVVEHLEERAAVRKKLLASLAYPAFVVTVAIGIGAMLVFYLLPKISAMLDSLGSELNFSMWLIMNGSEFLIKASPFMLAAVVIGGVSFFQWRQTARGRRLTDRGLLRLPLLGQIFRLNELYTVSSLIGTLTQSGINMTETLRLTERALNNTELRARFHSARTQVNEGLALANALRRHRILPDLALDILTVGENTGTLAHSLSEIAKGFREELSGRLGFLVTAVSSVALATAFALVALIAIGLITSVMQVSSSLSM